MFMLKNTQRPLKIQIEDLKAEQSDTSKIGELTSEELNLVAGGCFGHQCSPAYGASDM
jgi:hypothetical protein